MRSPPATDAGRARDPGGGALIAVTGTLYFADRDMKTDDNFFRGFPAVWNLVAFYLLLLRPAPAIAAGVGRAVRRADLCAGPFRASVPGAAAGAVTVALLTLWAVLALAAVQRGLRAGALDYDRVVCLGCVFPGCRTAAAAGMRSK